MISVLRSARPFSSLILLGFTVTAVVITGSGCNSEDQGPTGASGGALNTGGVANSGGASASGGSTSSGGVSTGGFASGGGSMGSGGSTGSGGGATACNAKVLDPGVFTPCNTCNGGRCVPKGDFPGTPAEYFDACGTEGICLPDNMVASKGEVALAKCSSVLGNEGRCTSLCFPAARAQSAVLPQDTCSAEERCTPCFNPVNGSPTGACDLGCDPGPTTQAILFTKCCTDRGYCVPRASIPGNAKDNLARESCTGTDDPVCVPAAIVNDPNYRFPPCESSVSPAPGTPGVPAGAGVCVPDCIVNSTQFGPFINRGSCGAGDKCVPCTNPVNGQPSGACL